MSIYTVMACLFGAVMIMLSLTYEIDENSSWFVYYRAATEIFATIVFLHLQSHMLSHTICINSVYHEKYLYRYG